LGSEFAGDVVEVGPDATRFQPGDRVFGITGSGGASAEYLTIAQDAAIAEIPVSISYHEAAGLPFGGLCALCFLSKFAGLKSGQKLLIVGASGGVGSYAVQIAKILGASVTGVSSSANLDFVRDLGADRQIAYDLVGQQEWPGGQDVILDTVGALTPSAARRLLAPGGAYFPLIFGLSEIFAALLNPFRARKTVIAANPDRVEDLLRLVALVDAGQLKPVIGHRFPLRQAGAAHELVEKRHRRGSVVLDLSSKT